MLKTSECAFNSELIQGKTLQLLPYADFKGMDGRPTTENQHLSSWKINSVIAERIIQATNNMFMNELWTPNAERMKLKWQEKRRALKNELEFLDL